MGDTFPILLPTTDRIITLGSTLRSSFMEALSWKLLPSVSRRINSFCVIRAQLFVTHLFPAEPSATRSSEVPRDRCGLIARPASISIWPFAMVCRLAQWPYGCLDDISVDLSSTFKNNQPYERLPNAPNVKSLHENALCRTQGFILGYF